MLERATFILLGLYGINAVQNCMWNVTKYDGSVFTLNLTNSTGQIHHQSDSTAEFFFSLCNNSLPCTQSGTTVYDMVSAFPEGVVECYHMASWDEGKTEPKYDYGSASWRFNYTNGQKCGDTNSNYEILVYFECHPGYTEPYLTKVYQYSDCGFVFQFQFTGACVPASPSNEECTFTAWPTKKTLDLSSLKGTDIVYKFDDGATWHFTPCSNGLTCEFPSGNSIATMSQIEDTSNGCAKFLGVWSGDVMPRYYKNMQGLDAWAFSWFDGMECDENDPPEEFEVVFICDKRENTYKVNGTSISRCHFTMEILTKHACT